MNGSRGRQPTLDALPVRPYLAAALLLLLVFLGANFKVFDKKHSPVWDAFDYFAPYYSLVADHARAGRVVLWNPWISGGSPDFAEPELGTLSPVQVLTGGITGGGKTGFSIYWLLIWYFGAVGMVPLARHFRAPAWGGFVVGLAWAFSGFFTGHAEHISSLYSIAFLPWIVWRLDVALTERRYIPVVQAGALWGLSALGGYPQLTILSGMFVALWAVGRWLSAPGEASFGRSESRPRLIFVVAALVVLVGIGLVVMSPSYVGFFSEAGKGSYSDVTGPRLREICTVSNALHAGALATFASPYLPMLKLFNAGLWEFTDVSMASVYLGALVPVLALLALLARPRSRWRWWLSLVALFFLACALGKHLPVRGWLYDLFPPTRYFRNAAMFSAYSMFIAGALALLASRDLQAAIERGTEAIWKRLSSAAGFVAVVAIAAYGLTIHWVANPGDDAVRATIGLIVVWSGVVATAALLWRRPQLRQALPVLLVLIAIVDTGFVVALAGRLTLVGPGFASNVWPRIKAEHVSNVDLTRNNLRRELRPPEWLNQPLFPDGHTPAQPPFAMNNRNLQLKLATLDNYNTLNNRFLADSIYQPVLAAMATGERRIWFAPDAPDVTVTDASYRAVVERSRALGAPVVVVHSRQEMAHALPRGQAGPHDGQDTTAISSLPPARQAATGIVYYGPNRLALDVTCPEDGWLLVTDRWAAGWKATVNGHPAEIFGGDFVYRAVRVKAGTNQVRFNYAPFGWPLLFVMSWGTLAIVIGLSIGASRLKRDRRIAVST